MTAVGPGDTTGIHPLPRALPILNLPGPQLFLPQILVLTWLGPKPSFMSGMRLSLSGISVFLRSQLQWVKGVIGGTHAEHLGYTCNSSLPPLCKSRSASSRTPGSITLAGVVTRPLTSWSLGTRNPKCSGISSDLYFIGNFAVSPGKVYPLWETEPPALQSP